MPLRPRRLEAQRPGGTVGWVVEPGRRLGDVEQLLAEEAELVLAVLVVEGDQVGQRSQRGTVEADRGRPRCPP